MFVSAVLQMNPAENAPDKQIISSFPLYFPKVTKQLILLGQFYVAQLKRKLSLVCIWRWTNTMIIHDTQYTEKCRKG